MQNGLPRTLNELILQATTRRINQVVMRFKHDKAWQDITGAELMERIRHVALALHERGVQPGDRVSILAESCPEWSITDYAILASGGVTVPIYPTQAVEQVAFILKNCGARLLFVSNQKLLRRIQSALDSLKGDAPQVILFDDKVEGYESLNAFAAQGASVAERDPELFQ